MNIDGTYGKIMYSVKWLIFFNFFFFLNYKRNPIKIRIFVVLVDYGSYNENKRQFDYFRLCRDYQRVCVRGTPCTRVYKYIGYLRVQFDCGDQRLMYLFSHGLYGYLYQ